MPNAFNTLPAQRQAKDPLMQPPMWEGPNLRLKGKLTTEMKVGNTEIKGFNITDLFHYIMKMG